MAVGDWDHDEYMMRKQQRFEASLRYATIQCAEREGFRMDYPTLSEAVKLADDLLNELDR